jgi:hypothetical protein
MRPLFLLALLSVAHASDIAFPAIQPPSFSVEMPQVVPKVFFREPRIKPIEILRFGRVLDDMIPADVDGLIDLYGSVANLRLALLAERVDVVALSAEKNGSKYVESRSKPLSEVDAATLRYILTSDATFDWSRDYDCAPDYAYRLKFSHLRSVICVDLCFRCRTLRVLRDGQEIAEKNFDFGYDTIHAILVRYFPDLAEEEANQALEPTALLVMPRACARVTPSKAVAHL